MGKSSGSGSAKTDVTEYRMSIHFGMALELDAVTGIRVDEKVAWMGDVTSNTAIQINQPDLYGGQKKEGGLVGTVQILLGRSDQVLPVAAASRYGQAPENCIGFRGVTTLMFHGSTSFSTGRAGEWDDYGDGWNGGSYGNGGFLWKMNSPLLAQKVDIQGRRAPKGLSPENAMIGPNANPAHIIYECLINKEWGMGGTAALINAARFEAEGLRLKNEAFGLTIWWTSQTPIEDFVTEVLDHIQATLFVNPNTGLLEMTLLRDDYDVANLRHITPDNAVLSNFKRRSNGEIVNEITVSYTNPENEEVASVTAQDIGSIASQGGEKVSTTRDYYGIRDPELAATVLARDLRASTATLVSADAKLDRSAWDVLPGEVMLLSWPRRGLNAAVVRAGKVIYGKPRDSAIRVSLLQDIFSLSRPPITIIPPGEGVDPRRAPEPLDMQLFTVPSYFVRNAEIQNNGVEIEDEEALVGALADSVSDDSLDYELTSESIAADGSVVVTSKGAMSLTPKAQLAVTLPAAATSTLSADLFPSLIEAPRTGGFIFIGYGDDNQEIALVTGRVTGGWMITRGVLDTVPKTWGAGTPVWSVNPGARIVDSQVIHSAGETVSYRGLDRTALGLLPYEDAPNVTAILTNRANLPLRPANVRARSTAFGSVAVGGVASFSVTWATRNRLLEDTQVLDWTDGSVVPEYRQETVVQVFDVATDALIVEYGSLWTETSLTFQKTDFDRYAAVRFKVIARKDGDDSLTGHSVTVTGFAANPAAPAPPAPPARTEPPSPIFAPAVGAFTCVAGTAVATDGSTNPTLEFAGIQDNPAAESLTTRVRPVGSSTWRRGRTVALNREQVSFPETGVLGATEYQVQIAYVVGGIIGMWRALVNVTTLTAIAGDLSPNSPIGAATALNTEQIATEILRGALWRAYSDGLLYLEGVPVGTVINQVVDQFTDEFGSYAGTLSLIGAKNGAGTGFILNADTVQIRSDPNDPTSALTSFKVLQLKTNDHDSAIQILQSVTDGFAEAKTLLVVDGRVVGTTSTNDGDVGTFDIQTDRLRLIDPDGTSGTEYRDGCWFTPDPATNSRIRQGALFGGLYKLWLWIGPMSVAEGSETKANAYIYISVTTYGGPLSGGPGFPTGDGGSSGFAQASLLPSTTYIDSSSGWTSVRDFSVVGVPAAPFVNLSVTPTGGDNGVSSTVQFRLVETATGQVVGDPTDNIVLPGVPTPMDPIQFYAPGSAAGGVSYSLQKRTVAGGGTAGVDLTQGEFSAFQSV